MMVLFAFCVYLLEPCADQEFRQRDSNSIVTFLCVFLFVCFVLFLFLFFFGGGGGLLFAVVSFCWGCIFLIDKGIVDPNIPLKAGHHYRTDNSGGGGGCVFIFLVYKGRVDPNIPLKAGHHRTDNGPTLNAGRVAL